MNPLSERQRTGASPLLSVVIPAFNRERYVVEAIESVLGQDWPIDEIVVVDDASTDETAARASGFEKVRVVRQPRRTGTAGARNAGIAASHGDLVAWLDSDDRWLPHHCSTVVPLLERFPESVLAFGNVEFVGQRRGLWPVFEFPEAAPFDAFQYSFERNVPPMMATIIRRNALVEIGGFDESLSCSVDFDLFLRLSRVGPFVCSHLVTAHYRWHGEQISTKPLAQLQAIYTSREKMLRALNASGEESRASALNQRALDFLHDDLWTAWGRRDLHRLRVLLEVGRGFDGADRVAAPFRYRRHAPRALMSAWDALLRTAGLS
jgi:glycosyltransferase involved in cell wall biosynthesis